MAGAYFNNVRIVTLLARREDTDPNLRDGKGQVALMYAVMRCNGRIASVLAENSRCMFKVCAA